MVVNFDLERKRLKFHHKLNLCPIYKLKEHEEDRMKAKGSVQTPQCLSKRKNDIQESDYEVLEGSYCDIYFTKNKQTNKQKNSFIEV